MTEPTDKFKKIGKEWQKNGMHRIYFNNLAELRGLECTHYKTGNISSAYLGGEKISNGRAREIMTTLDSGKVWYDCNTGKFECKGISDEALEIIVAEITARTDQEA